ncbi:MAG TPA: cytochrome c oxidase assembly factor Coa1 family protein, partial [Terriglobia bacterium]|nr:cytochrome c oxidase assembly factor Coa1 family protein [Terriglobia bacterium]
MPGQIPVQPKNWLERNWKLLLGLLVVLGVLGIAAVLGILTLIMASIRGSNVAREAMARAKSNPVVVQRLGTPIEVGWLVSGSINSSSGSGDADLALPVSGPKGKGTVYVTAQKNAGAWTYTLMQAAIEGSGERIDLLAPASMAQPTAAAPTPSPAAAIPAAPSAPSAAATPPQPNAAAPNSSAAV